MPLARPEADSIEQELNEYLRWKAVFDAILGAVVGTPIGKYYKYYDHETPFFVEPSLASKLGTAKTEKFVADVVFKDDKRNGLLLVEYTENNPGSLDKFEQLRKYCCVSNDSAKTIVGTDTFPGVEVMLVCPLEARSAAQGVHASLMKDPVSGKRIGGKIGFTAWGLAKDLKRIIRVAGEFRDSALRSHLLEELAGYHVDNTIPILKTAPAIEILRYLYLRILMTERGNETPNLTRNKITEWLGEAGIFDEKKYAEALKLGDRIGFLENVDLTSLYAEPKYSRDHPKSISHGTAFIKNPIEFLRGPVDEDQKSLNHFRELEAEDDSEDGE